VYDQLWSIDRTDEVRNRTWWWWWWIFFFDNPEDPIRPKQLMVFWATRNCKKVLVNGQPWRRTKPITVDGDRTTFDGLAAGWWYDGKEMHEPYFLRLGRLEMERDGEHGRVFMELDGTFELSGGPEGMSIDIECPETSIHVKTRKWTDPLWNIRPSGKRYLGHLGYKMLKIWGAIGEGSVGGESVSGTGYFQNVRINSPTSPWYWAVLHCKDGSYIDYFMPHLGLPMFRRTKKHGHWLDRGIKPLSKGFDYFDGPSETLYKVKNIRMSQEYVDDLPVFTLTGTQDDFEMELVIEAYSRACWIPQQPFLGIFNTRLFYNEYPSFVRSFRLTKGDEVIREAGKGEFVGNTEHSWGIV